MRSHIFLLATLASMFLATATNPVPQDGGEQNNGQYTAWAEPSTTTALEDASLSTVAEAAIPTLTEALSMTATQSTSTTADTNSSPDTAGWTRVAELIDNSSATAVAEVTASSSAEPEPTQVYEDGETKGNSVVSGEEKSNPVIRSRSAAASAIVALYGAVTALF